MKILNTNQIKKLDQATIQNEAISSLDLMERASLTFVNWFINTFPNTHQVVQIFCGIGNNGGDGLAVARLLSQRAYTIQVFYCKISPNTSQDFEKNLARLPKRQAIEVFEIEEKSDFPALSADNILIDAIFGSGLNRPVIGYWASLIKYINQTAKTIVAIDIPSGLFADQATTSTHIQAHYTCSFELPKLAFLFPENQHSLGYWTIKPIRLDANFIKKTNSPYYYITPNFIKSILKTRHKFDHKGTYGHALLVAGSYGKVGAAVLAAKACLRTGAGLVSVHSPKCAYQILQISFPEAMVSIDTNESFFSQTPNLKPYKAIGIGCGLGTENISKEALADLIKKTNLALVLDADALNILAQNKELLKQLPKNSILTPHPKEFERLFGKADNDFNRNELQRKKAQELQVYIVLKGANTCIATPEGDCYFNSTGNPGMGTAGTGDVLTGMITSLKAQGYSSLDAAILGVYLHGLAGDLAVLELGQEALLASDVIAHIGRAFRAL